jgi:methyl-accepting chemotaxis protein
MTIKARLGIFISVTMGFTVVIAIIGFWGAVNLSSKLNEMGKDGVLATRYLAETQDAMWQLRYGISQYLAVPDPASREKIINESPKWFGIMDENLKLYAGGNLTKEAKDGLQKMIEMYEQYKEARPKWLKLMEANKTKEAAEFRSKTILISGAATVRYLNNLREIQGKRSNEIDMSSAVSVRKVKIFICLVSAILILSSLAIAFWIARSLLGQLGGEPEYVTEVARQVADGDLTMNIGTKKADATSMLHAMKNMVSNLKGIVGKARETADHVASAGQQLSASSEQMSKGVAEQAGRVSQIASASTEMTQTAVDMARNASKIAISAKETSGIAEQGEKIVSESIVEVKTIADTVNESSMLIASLGKRSKQIGDIIGVIDEIANQTNMLALNAAIEAARAGEQGRGFAVVADEVKKLAEKTAKSTSEIEPMIKDIQDEVQKAVSSMQEVTKRVEVGVGLSTQAGSALHNIVKSVNDLQAMIQQVAAATEEMSTVSETIGGDIEKIAVFSNETSTSAGEVAKSSTDLARLASNLQEIVTHFKIT